VIRTASLLELIEELTDYALANVPDKNCSCHISPPCNDCVTYSHQRELAERSRIAQRELRLVLLIDPKNSSYSV
jgi:hypothetical protein